MPIIYYIEYGKDKIEPTDSTKFIVNFFGILGCIKVNVLDNDRPKEQTDKFKKVDYYFDYPYFSEIVNPECFKKEELDNRERRFTKTIITLWLCSFLFSTAIFVLLLLACAHKKPKAVLAILAPALLILSTIATVFFVIGISWVFFDFIKEKFIAHRIESLLNDLDHELIKKYKTKLIGKKEDDIEARNQGAGKENDIKDIIEFFLQRKNISSLYKFLTNGEELVQAGMAMVNHLLINGVHPNDIVLDTNSLGGGIAAEVLKRFEDNGIYLTLIHSNSYSTLKDASRNFPYGVGNFFMRWLPGKFLDFWFRHCDLEFNPQEIIENTKCPVLVFSREEDTVIPKKAQVKINDAIIPGEKFRLSGILEHDPEQKCSNKNVHTDTENHLIIRYDDDNTRYESCTKVKDDFIYISRKEHLIKYGLNKHFNKEKYAKSDFSKDLTAITLEFLKTQIEAPSIVSFNNNCPVLQSI